MMNGTFELGDVEFSFLREFLRDRFGLHYPRRKKGELDKACAEVADGLDPGRFCNVVTSPTGQRLLQRLINHLTIGETYFFRIQPHFDALKNVILPDLFKRKGDEKALRIWSAGCATGEEPYSIAMLILETLRNPEEWTIDFLATDVNTEFLDAALEGLYREWSFRKVGDFWRTKYFRPEGDEWRVAGKVRGMVRFATANLLDERDNVVAAGPAPFDLIVCRNVLIYFDDESIARVGALFRRYLAPGGWYVGGHVEPVVFDDGFEPVSFPGAILYRKLLPDEVSARAKRRPAEEPRRRPALERRAPTDELEKADRLVAAGDDGRALVELAALTEKRHDPEVYWRMGRVLGNLGRYEEGLEWCRKAAELNQRNPFPYYISALILEEMGKNEESFENLRRSLFVDKGFVLGHFSMANYYRWREDDERAARSYRNVLRLLDGREDGEHIAGDGLTVGRLREIVNQIL